MEYINTLLSATKSALVSANESFYQEWNQPTMNKSSVTPAQNTMSHETLSTAPSKVPTITPEKLAKLRKFVYSVQSSKSMSE